MFLTTHALKFTDCLLINIPFDTNSKHGLDQFWIEQAKHATIKESPLDKLDRKLDSILESTDDNNFPNDRLRSILYNYVNTYQVIYNVDNKVVTKGKEYHLDGGGTVNIDHLVAFVRDQLNDSGDNSSALTCNHTEKDDLLAGERLDQGDPVYIKDGSVYLDKE